MKIENLLDELIKTIKADHFFDDIKVIKAYPCSAAPVHLTKETIAVGFDEIALSSVSVDESSRAGDVSVFMDIFIPIKADNGRVNEIFSRLCKCFYIFNILSISAQRVSVDVNSASYVMKTKFTFNSEIEVI